MLPGEEFDVAFSEAGDYTYWCAPHKGAGMIILNTRRMKYTHNYMKIFLDTADTEVISKYYNTGLIDGITTNPTLIMKSGRNPEEVYQESKILVSKISVWKL